MHIVHARFNPFEPVTFHFTAELGKTVEEIVAACDVPAWFWIDGLVQVNGLPVLRERWGEIVPVANDVITMHAVISGGGGGGGSTKNTITIVAAIALVVAATAVSGGLLAAPAIGLGASFAAGGLGATLTAAALGLGATALLSTLTPPPLPGAKPAGEGRQEASAAGIAANQIRPLANLPAVLGRMRYSPPLLAPAYTTFDNEILTLHAIVGLAGRYDQATLQINGIDIAEFDQAVIQTRYGTASDAAFTICTDTVIEDPRNATLSNFILEAKSSLAFNLVHQADPDRDLPQWQFYKTAGDADEIRIRLNWPAGFVNNESDTQALMPVRVEIRERGTVPWLKMPVVHFTDIRKGRGTMRKEIRLLFLDTLPGGQRVNLDTELDAFAAYVTTGSGQPFQYDAETYFSIVTPTDQLPVFSSSTQSGHTVTSSSVLAPNSNFNAVDSSTSSYWAPQNNTLPVWWKVQLNIAKTFLSFAIRSPDAGATAFAPSAWLLEGSNDNTTWTTLGSYANITDWTVGVEKWFQIDTPGSYLYYRFWITANNGGGSEGIIIPDLKFGITDAPGSESNAALADNVTLTDNGCEIYLKTATFPKGEYEVRVKRGFAASFADFDPINYSLGGSDPDANFFEYYLTGGVYKVRRNQRAYSSQAIVEQFATIEHVYPFDPSIHTKGVTMIAIEAESLTVNSLSAIFHSVVPVYTAAMDWSEDEATSNPAALRRHVLLGQENALALPGEILNEEQHAEFFQQCDAEGHEFNAIIDGMTVAQVVQQIDAGGYGLAVYPSAQWGVIFEYDRSPETPVQVFTPVNTRTMTVSRDFAKLPHGFRVTYFDEDNDWQIVAPEPIVYMDGFNAGNAERIETLELPGFTNGIKATARAQFDIRQLYLRNSRYGFEIGIEGLVAERGDLVGLNHDVISRYHDFARVKTVVTSGGNVTGLTLEAKVDLGIAVGEVTEAMSAVIQLTDRTLLIKPVAELALTDVLTFVAPFAIPAGGTLTAGCVVGFGVVDTETKRCLVHTIEYVDLLTRRITLVDEAPALHA